MNPYENPFSDLNLGVQAWVAYIAPMYGRKGIKLLSLESDDVFEPDEDLGFESWVWYEIRPHYFEIKDEVGNDVGEVFRDRKGQWHWAVFWECSCHHSEKSRDGSCTGPIAGFNAAKAASEIPWRTPYFPVTERELLTTVTQQLAQDLEGRHGR